MKSDIEIAQEARMLPIKEVASPMESGRTIWSVYGKYKAKLTRRSVGAGEGPPGRKTGAGDRHQPHPRRARARPPPPWVWERRSA